MLKPILDYNNISPELRKRLTEDRKQAGKTVKYKFSIAHRNPDAANTGGEYLYPALYTLTPITFNIIDPGDSTPKLIGWTKSLDRSHKDTEEVVFNRVQIPERFLGILTLDLTQIEHIEMFEYIQMHPKLEGGMFRDKNIAAMVSRVDDLKEAKTKLAHRQQRSECLMVASRMTEPEIREFAAAMNWNELEDLDILRDRTTELADKDPDFFRKFVDDPRNEYKAVLRRGLDANVISYIPMENKFTWTGNGNTIAMLDRSDGDKHFDNMADWFMTNKNGQDTYKKIKSLLAGK